MVMARRKNLGNKRNDITAEDRDIIVKAYGEFKDTSYEVNGKVCESKIFDKEDFGFRRIQVESPLIDENGDIVTKGKKNQPVADASKRDFENVPLKEDIGEYFDREVKPYNQRAWIDTNKTKIGYEIPFTRYFYKYEAPEKSEDIAARIAVREKNIMDSLNKLFGEEV